MARRPRRNEQPALNARENGRRVPGSPHHTRPHFSMVETLLSDGRDRILNTPSLTLADIHRIWPFDWALQPEMRTSLPKDVFLEDIFPWTFA